MPADVLPTRSNAMNREKMNLAVSALRGLFDEEEIPAEFAHQGQTFEERSEVWLLHAVEQLEKEIEAFKAGG
jgi:hypothetical protein